MVTLCRFDRVARNRLFMKNEYLIQKIETAFDGVRPGKIGIRCADAYDSRLKAEDLDLACSQDTEMDWKLIPDRILSRNDSIFGWFDAAGFKFILPAMMRWSLKPDFHDKCGVIEMLVDRLLPCETYQDHNGSTFWRKGTPPESLVEKWNLSFAQISTIIEWLEYYRNHIATLPLMPLAIEQLESWKVLAK